MKSFFTKNEIMDFFKEEILYPPTGLFKDNYIFKEYKGLKSGDIVSGRISEIKIFGFFRSDKIYVIYKNVSYGSYGWCGYSDIII